MYGIVNLAVEDFVVSSHGEEVWLQIREDAGVTDIPTFVTMDQYPDDITYRLVQSISERLGISSDEALRLFGRHWMRYTSEHGFGDLLRFAGSSVREFLGNIDAIHSQVAAGMPGLKTPTIEVEDVDDEVFLVHYHSPREGLAMMLVGVFEGIGEMFDSELDIEHRERTADGADHDVFEVRTRAKCLIGT